MLTDLITEARRQLEVCNACRYCENLCSVFPELHQRRNIADGEIQFLADLCHNCRGCFYACQYVAPHEFAINLPAALSEVRSEGWQKFALPSVFARVFQQSGVAITMATIFAFTLILTATIWLADDTGSGFYGILPHDSMLAIFLPVFCLSLFSVTISLTHYWKAIDGGSIQASDLADAGSSAASLRDLSGGHGKGCNFEAADKFSHWRRWMHQFTLIGFTLCFTSTSVATLMHYAWDLPAPYPFFSLPKLLGVSGGILLCLGCGGLIGLKLRANPTLGTAKAWGGEMGFVLLLFLVSASGLALYWFGESGWLTELLVFHLGTVLTFFVLTPYTKMVHGFYRLAALIKNAINKRSRGKS